MSPVVSSIVIVKKDIIKSVFSPNIFPPIYDRFLGYSSGFFLLSVAPRLTDTLLLDHASRIHKLPRSISLICSSSKDEDNFLKDTCYPVSTLLSDSLFEPVIKG